MDRIIIMGASSGIGLKVAEEFAKRGVHVGVAARRGAELVNLKIRYPDFVEYEEIDINSKEAPERLQSLIDKLGGMDIYFHVAGIGYDNPPLESEREFEIIKTNSASFARMLSTAYRYFRDSNKSGRIAAVTSVAGTKGIDRMAAYSASKKCDQTYMVALEQLAHNEGVKIKFTDIRPGWIRTPLLKDFQNYPLEMTLEEVVPLIIKAIVKAPRVAVIDWKWNLVVGAWRLIPNCIWTKMDVPVN